MNLPPLAEHFTHIQRGTEPKAANLSHSLSTHLTSPAALENPTQETAKSVRHSGGFLQKITWGFCRKPPVKNPGDFLQNY